MLTKTRLKEHIEGFPEEFSLDELIEHLIVVEKIELGLEQSKNGETISESELEQDIQEWFK